jgi:nitrite reductase/ring-hydroxylating ferredoxin subunit
MSDWVRIEGGEGMIEGAMIAGSAGGKRLIVYRTGSGYFATDRRCSHQGADLMRGYFDRDVIECPVHQGRFSVRTGEPLSAPACVALNTYSVKLLDGAVYVQVE